MSENLQYHEAANIFPMMDEAAFREFKADIEQHGLREPIEICDGKIIDGRNRYLACLELGITCTQLIRDVDDPVSYVLSKNLHRRHLTASQKSMAASKAEKLNETIRKEAEKRQAESIKERDEHGRAKSSGGNVTTSGAGKSRDKIGKLVGVSGSMIDRAAKVLKEGVPELAKAVEDGRMSVTVAAKLVNEDHETQREAAKEAKFSGGRYRNPAPKKTSESIGSVGAPPDYDKTERFAVECARCAITQLEQIKPTNPGREKALSIVEKWIKSHRSKS